MDKSVEDLATSALNRIEAAFGDNPPPAAMSDSKQLLDFEYDEVMSFEGMAWRDVVFDQVERYSGAIFWFSPEAFRYYLPGFLCAGLREGRCDANAYDALIGMLDRSPDPGLWDDFFLPRWPSLTDSELEAVAAWVEWLKAIQPDAFFHNTYERVQDTLDLLRQHRAAGGD